MANFALFTKMICAFILEDDFTSCIIPAFPKVTSPLEEDHAFEFVVTAKAIELELHRVLVMVFCADAMIWRDITFVLI